MKKLSLLSILLVSLLCVAAALAWPPIDAFMLGGSRTAPVTANVNYFGTGADGALSTSGNVSYNVTTDSEMLVKNYTSLTINAGHTVTTSTRCKGLLIFVKGNCTIDGTLTMTARGAYVNAATAGVSPQGLQFAMLKTGGSSLPLAAPIWAGSGTTAITAMSNMPNVSSGASFWVKRSGASGGAGGGGAAGSSGDGYQSGGGGCGANCPYTAGDASAGTCFSGGVGSGGGGDAGTANGGPGGAGYNNGYGGGAGNPCGVGGIACTDGTGGLLVLVVGGNLTIGAGGSITSRGSQGGQFNAQYAAGGGGSGGGNIIVVYAGALSNAGTLSASGGAGGASDPDGCGVTAGSGGAGSIQGPTKVDPA